MAAGSRVLKGRATIARALVALAIAIAPSLAFAQQTQPAMTAPPLVRERGVRGIVVDARGSLAKFGLRPEIATGLGVKTADLPGPGRGITAGAHVYLLPIGKTVIGAGGELMLTSRSRKLVDTNGEPTGTVLTSRAFSLSPQLSLNFGRAEGWSYVSAGYGVVSWETWNDAGDRPDRRHRGLNYGGGARWFAADHLAFSVDLRFYHMPAAEAEPLGGAARPAQRLLILSAGLSLK